MELCRCVVASRASDLIVFLEFMSETEFNIVEKIAKAVVNPAHEIADGRCVGVCCRM